MLDKNKHIRPYDQVVIGDDFPQESYSRDVLNKTRRFDSKTDKLDQTGAEVDFQPNPSDRVIKELRPGAVLENRYRVQYHAGSGAMGQVWYGYDMHMGHPVAIKLISARHQNSTEAMDQFREGFKLVHELNHPNVCPTTYMGNDEAYGYFFVMKWIPESLYIFRESLESQGQTLSHELIRSIITMLAQGLDYVHEQRVIHRDLKPDNITITRDENGKFKNAQLIDFGLSQKLGQGSDTRFGDVACGTPSYMAPEQWTNSTQNEKTDQYALAMVAYELYGGHVAFSNKSFELLRNSVLNDLPEQLPAVPSYVNQALQRGLAKDPDDRFDNCVDFAKALAPPVNFWTKYRFQFLITILVAAIVGVGTFYTASLTHMLRVETANVYSTTDRTLKLGNEGQPLSFVLASANVFSGENTNAVESIEIPKTSTVTIDGIAIEPLKSGKGKGWSYTDDGKGTGTLLLDNYAGGPILARAVNLKVEVADDTKNVITAGPGKNALSVRGGNLIIEGGKVGNGALDIVCTGGSSSPSAKPVPAAIEVCGNRKNLLFRGFRSLEVKTSGGVNGLFVERGNILVDRIPQVNIFCSSGCDAIHVGGGVTVLGNTDSKHVINGGFHLLGRFYVFDAAKPSESISHLPFVLEMGGRRIDYLAESFEDLASSLEKNNTIGTVTILVTDNIRTVPRVGVSGDTFSSLIVGRGEHVLLSSGHWTISKGHQHDPDEELLIVNGNLICGLPEGMGTSTLTFDGGCSRIPMESSTTGEPLIFEREDGRFFEVVKYRAEHTTKSALVCVAGKLCMHEGITIKNNINSRTNPDVKKQAFEFSQLTGGVHVFPEGRFEMRGGRIAHCESALGAGVSVAGEFLLEGGEICYNTGVHSNGLRSAEGGGVFVAGGKFMMGGGRIANNIALGNGTGIDGETCGKGGGIHLSQNSKCHISGGEIVDNHSLWAGGGIYVGGSGTAQLFVSDDAKIVGNSAVVGAGIFMNAFVSLNGGTVANNSLIDGPSATLPAGPGVYIYPRLEKSLPEHPSLRIGGSVSISEDNSIFVATNVALGNILLSDQKYFPIIVTQPFSEKASERIVINAGSVVFSDKNESLMVLFNSIAHEDENTMIAQANRFVFGFLGVPDNRNHVFARRTIQLRNVATGAVSERYYLALVPK